MTDYQTSGYVKEWVYKEWKSGNANYPASWCMNCSGPGLVKVTEEQYLAGDFSLSPRDEVMIFCEFSFDISKLDDPVKYAARRRYFGRPL